MEILRFLEGIRTPFLDAVFGFITVFGEETVAIFLLCAIYWCISKRVAYGIGVGYFLSGLTIQGMKICFRINRPWVIDPTLKPVPSALKTATGYSFPSGHTQGAAALFGTLGVHFKRRLLKAACFLLLILVAFSRMYLGVHTLLDVSVALIISFLFILLTALILKDEIGKKQLFILSSAMLLYAAAVIVVAVVLFSSGTIERDYLSDCLKAAGAGIGFAVGMFIERVYIKFPVKTKNIFMQAVKLVLGLAGMLAIKEGLKLIIGTGFVVDTVRYFLMLLWIAVFYPLIIKRFFAVTTESVADEEMIKRH